MAKVLLCILGTSFRLSLLIIIKADAHALIECMYRNWIDGKCMGEFCNEKIIMSFPILYIATLINRLQYIEYGMIYLIIKTNDHGIEK